MMSALAIYFASFLNTAPFNSPEYPGLVFAFVALLIGVAACMLAGPGDEMEGLE